MTPDRFATLIDAYGASPERWPTSERQAALAYLQATPAAQALVAEAGRLDALLDRLETPAIDIDLARITATAQEPSAHVLADCDRRTGPDCEHDERHETNDQHDCGYSHERRLGQLTERPVVQATIDVPGHARRLP